MKTVFFCRSSALSRWIANSLSRSSQIDAIVIEGGRSARGRKLRRTFRDTSWWQFPTRGLDLAAVALYGRLAERHLQSQLLAPSGITEFPKDLPLHHVDDGNEPRCAELLEELAPDVLLVTGTSILKPQILDIPRRYALNIHGGIVPEYRNVHSDFWALNNGDYDKVGISIIHLDPGIDSGAVALRKTVDVVQSESVFEVKCKLARVAAEAAQEALRRAEAGDLPRQSQDAGQVGFFRAPTARQLLAFYLK